MSKLIHKPVLLNETIKSLNIKPNGIYLDLTCGGGGHAQVILSYLNNEGKLIGFDQDLYAVNKCQNKFKDFKNFTIVHSNFKNLEIELNKLNISKVDGILMDLGMSSFQIDDPERGFSYMSEGPLDMRMNINDSLTAHDILNTYEKNKLAEIFKTYGEEPNSYKIASLIVKNRPLNTTLDLVKITDRMNVKGHSAKRVFQALRIYINKELDVLENTLPFCLNILNKNGVLSIITFHSLEDKIVKKFIKENAEEKVIKGLPLLPVEMPLRYSEKRFYKPKSEEIENNPRAKSAILRVAIKN